MTKSVFGNTVLLKGKRPFCTHLANRYRAHWDGLIYINGVPSGESSVAVFLDEARAAGIQSACIQLKGIFFMALEDLDSGDLYAWVDNSGLYRAYHSDSKVSTSFLSLVEDLGLSVSDLDPEAVVEFLHIGCVFADSMMFPKIRKIPADGIVVMPRDTGQVLHLKKSIPHLHAPHGSATGTFDALDEFFRGLASSLANRKVSVDLTGGVDSRLIALFLRRHGLDIEAAISGGSSDFEDVVLSENVASAMGIRWHSTIQAIDTLESQLEECFSATEGLTDILYYHRLLQLQKDRIARGADTLISGIGGELFKDYWWIQDFPFYSRRIANMGRLLATRVMPFRPMEGAFSGEFELAGRDLRKRMNNDLSKYRLDTNTRTYDNIYFNCIATDMGGPMLTAHSAYLACCAPYLDLDVARVGFHLPRHERFFNMVQRRMLTKLDPYIAALPTSEGGMSASAAVMRILSDVPRFGWNRLSRLLVKMGIKRRSPSSLNHPQLLNKTRALKMTGDVLNELKKAGIVRSNVGLGQIDDRFLGNFLSLGMLVRHLGRDR